MLDNWSWDQFSALPQTDLTNAIHCVTKWTKFDTRWRGLTISDLLRAAGLATPPSAYLMVAPVAAHRLDR